MKPVKDPRAYLKGLGTTSLVVTGALLVLVTVSALVAFSDWSLVDPTNDVDELLLKDAPSAGQPEGALASDAVAAQAAAAAAPASGVGNRAGIRTRARSGTGSGDGFGGPADGRSRPRTGPDLRGGGPFRRRGVPQPVPAGDSAPSQAPPASEGRGPVHDITKDVADTTEDLTGELGGAVGDVSPDLGDAVGGAGGVLGDTVRGVGGS